MIELKHLGKIYSSASGSVEALKDVNLTIADGEIFGIIGLSGAGKSTLVRCINLLERPTSGEVLLDGKLDDIIKREVDCIVCMDDAICMEVLYKLRREGISVPDQIRVASFYNSSMLETHDPSITSLDFDAKELGMLVCRTLLDMIEGQKVQKKTLLGYEVRLRESTK